MAVAVAVDVAVAVAVAVAVVVVAAATVARSRSLAPPSLLNASIGSVNFPPRLRYHSAFWRTTKGC